MLITNNLTISIVLTFFLALEATSAVASGCKAENPDTHDSCSIECAEGQAASCSPGSGSVSPLCQCDGSIEKTFNDYIDAKKLAIKKSSINDSNIQNVINAKLQGLRGYTIAQSCADEVVGQKCHKEAPKLFGSIETSAIECEDVIRNVCVPQIGKLSATMPISLQVEPKVIVGQPNWKAIPDEILGYRETYTNCTSALQSIIFKQAETIKSGARVSKTKTISTGQSIGAKVGFNYVVAGEVSVNFSNNVTITNADEESHEDTKTLEFTNPLNIPAFKKIVMEHFYVRRDVPIPYSGTVQVDSGVSHNLEGVTAISQLLPTPEERTFEFAGVVTIGTLIEGSTSAVESTLTPSICGSNKNFSSTAEPFYKTVVRK